MSHLLGGGKLGDLTISEFVVIMYVTSGRTYTGEKTACQHRQVRPMGRYNPLRASFLRVISWITFGTHPLS